MNPERGFVPPTAIERMNKKEAARIEVFGISEPTAEVITTLTEAMSKRVSYENRRYARI